MADSNRITGSTYAFRLFTLGIVLLPVGLGGDRPVPLALAQLGMGISALILAFKPQLLRQAILFSRLRWALALLAAVIVWAFIQTQPFVPHNWAHPLWQEVSSTLQKPVAASISIVPEDALKGLMRLMTYIAAGFLAYVFAQDAKRAKQFINAFWVTGSVICLYGFVIQLADLKQILWFDKWAYVDDLTATFVNRNHFAIYAGIVLVTGLALMMQSWRDAMRNCKPHKKIAAIRDWCLNQGLLRAASLALVFICIVLSHSRAGLMCSLIGVGACLFFYQIYQRKWGRAAIIIFAVVLMMILALGLALQLSDRFTTLFQDYSSQTRMQVYELTWRALKDNPWLGYGLNGFEPEYRLYQRNMFEAFNHAHSDILESLLDLGVIGGLALWAAIGLFLSGLWHGVRTRRQNGIFPVLGLSIGLMVLGHSLVDFDLQIPGIAMTWAAFLGTGLAHSWPQAERKAEA